MKKKIKKVKCCKCYGVGHRMSSHGMKACEECNTTGYVIKEVRAYNKKTKTVVEKIAKSFFCGLKAEGYQQNQCQFTCRYCRLGNHPQKQIE